MGVAYGQPLSYPSHAQGGNSSFGGTSTYYPYWGYVLQAPMSNHVPAHNRFMYPSNAPPNSYPLYTQPINPLPNTPAYPNYGPTGLFADSTGCVTPFVFWIEDYPLLDELKMPSHVGSYDEKGDPGNYLHLFKGAITDHGHDNNQCRELRNQIEEAVKSGQLAHLVKGIKKGKAKVSDTQLGEWKKGDKDTAPTETPILMVNREGHTSKRKLVEEPVSGTGSLRVDSKVPLVGFSGEHSWPIREVPLEITIGDGLFTRTETLNFVIVRSNSPHNLLLGRTAMQKMGIVVSMIHGATKFHTPRGIVSVTLDHFTSLTLTRK
ncbi:hypothetical protein Tco_0356246 [Tanacetum coccineum]